MSAIEDDSPASSDSAVTEGGYSYLPLHGKGVQRVPVACSRKMCIFYGIFSLVSATLIATLCALTVLWLQQSRHFFATAAVDATGLPTCNSSQQDDGIPRELPCSMWQDRSQVILLGLQQPIAPLRLREASINSVADISVIHVTPDASGLRIARAGLYQINAQVTFLEAHLDDNVAARVSVNGRSFAQCHGFVVNSGTTAGGMPCRISVVRRFAAGDHVTLGADPLLAVAADPTMTFLGVATLDGVRESAAVTGRRGVEEKKSLFI